MKDTKKETKTKIDIDGLMPLTYLASQLRLTLDKVFPGRKYQGDPDYNPYDVADELEECGDMLLGMAPQLKTALKRATAFEIVKSKDVNIRHVRVFGSADVYNDFHSQEQYRHLTDEEFALLKELCLEKGRPT